MDKERVKREISQLVEKYNKVAAEKRVGKYNEEMTKKDFILPYFQVLSLKKILLTNPFINLYS